MKNEKRTLTSVFSFLLLTKKKKTSMNMGTRKAGNRKGGTKELGRGGGGVLSNKQSI